MIAPDRVAVILLAAGASRRFGPRDKLLAPLGGQALAGHAASMLGAMPWGARIAVCVGDTDALHRLLRAQGFAVATGRASDDGMAGSLGIGVERALACDVDAALICLADMPYVPSSHIMALLAAYDGAPVTSGDESGVRMPPAIVPRADFAAIAALRGDKGARALLAQARALPAPPGALRDIDRPGDLAGTIGALHS